MTDDQKNYLKEIHDGNTRMVDLVNSLLNVSRLELGTFAVEPVPTDLVAIAESVLSELAPQIASKHQHLEKRFESGLPQVPVDPKLFRMIIQNLASNAVKYTPEGGSVEIGIEKKDFDILITVPLKWDTVSTTPFCVPFCPILFRDRDARTVAIPSVSAYNRTYRIKTEVPQKGGEGNRWKTLWGLHHGIPRLVRATR